MKSPSPFAAWKFFKNKFNASERDAEAIVNIISTTCMLRGLARALEAKNYKSHQEMSQAIEDMAHPKHSIDLVLKQFFDIDRTKTPNFDPIELSDSLGRDPRVARLFR